MNGHPGLAGSCNEALCILDATVPPRAPANYREGREAPHHALHARRGTLREVTGMLPVAMSTGGGAGITLPD